jgi:hypothetical protein
MPPKKTNFPEPRAFAAYGSRGKFFLLDVPVLMGVATFRGKGSVFRPFCPFFDFCLFGRTFRGVPPWDSRGKTGEELGAKKFWEKQRKKWM